MRKILLIGLGTFVAASVFGQGFVVLENSVNSGNVSILGGPFAAQYAAPDTYQVALLWYDGTSFQQIGAVYQSGGFDGPGYFFGEEVTVPVYQSTGTFKVEGWTGNFADYAAAVAGGAAVGLTTSFISAEGNSQGPFTTPVNLALPSPGPGNWDGNLVMVPVPEPSTVALGALALWFFRRRK